MKSLRIGTKNVQTVFDLLGTKEDDMTYGLGWCLANSENLLRIFCNHLGYKGHIEEANVALQRFGDIDRGFTDLEITVPGKFMCVIEAKKGHVLPDRNVQLRKYAGRQALKEVKQSLICILSSYDKVQLDSLPGYMNDVCDIPVTGMSWKTVIGLAKEAQIRNGHFEKHLLEQYISYLKGIITMRDPLSNLVYVVSLGNDTHEGWKISWIDICKKRDRYFHPVGGKGGWPSEPMNYLGFRYKGKLQSIRHVENVKTVLYLDKEFPEIPKSYDRRGMPHFLYTLGPEIKPENHNIEAGKGWRAQRVWCMLDTLLTNKTLKEAVKMTKQRLQTAGDAQ